MHFVYVIFNSESLKFYVGETSDINRRFSEHKDGKNISTKFQCKYWNLVYTEIYKSKKDAIIRERRLKHHGSAMVEIKKRISNSIKIINNKTEEGER